ncbi:MAG: Lipid II:glycine glycyltransferase [Chloroflexi bacterium]|nr:Lipid II:glycine glycyltransferase [Chloroflexota bacterium]
MLKNWNKIIATLPNPHVLQTREWASVKAKYGWESIPVAWTKEKEGHFRIHLRRGLAEMDQEPAAAALLLQRKMPLGVSVIYVPKGPLLRDWGDAPLRERVLQDLAQIARRQKAIFIKIDPDVVLGKGLPGKNDAEEDPLGEEIRSEWKGAGWQFSADQIQYRNTVLVDLTAPEDDILMRMKSKTRYNIRLAGRKGVTVREGDRADLGMLYQMYADTSLRGGFAIRGEAYYQTVWETFVPSSPETTAVPDPVAVPLIAEVEGEAVAGAVIFRCGKRAWYLHGMSSVEHRKKMPTYLIQWEAMRWAKKVGCTVYDMWGAPDVFEKSDPMWGVYRFKRGFGGQVSRTIGAWDLVLRPGLYKLYTTVLPKLLEIMRRIGKQRIQRS